LSKRLFAARVVLIGEIEDRPEPQHSGELQTLRADLVTRLTAEVAGMNLDNFEVRPKRRVVEKYQKQNAWNKLGLDARSELIENIAGMPSSLEDDDLAAKQFDLLVLKAQLALLQADRGFESYCRRICELGALLEELRNVPMVEAELELILEVQTDAFWQDITAPILETIRRRLRALIKLIESKKRPHIYTDFEDEIGTGAEIEVSGVAIGTDTHRFLLKARHFLKDHLDHITIQKLRRNEPLTAQDLDELERIFAEAGVADKDQLEKLREHGGLGVLIRSMVGLNREAAKSAFGAFIHMHNLNADQTEFLNMIIDYLTERGVMDPRSLYESPFTDINSMGVEGVFNSAEVVELVSIIEEFRRRAAA
jgi:type I restriction enzyme R subunit